MSQVVTIQRGNRTLVIEKLTQCEDCGRWFTVTIGIEIVPGKPDLQLCPRDYLLSQTHRRKISTRPREVARAIRLSPKIRL